MNHSKSKRAYQEGRSKRAAEAVKRSSKTSQATQNVGSKPPPVGRSGRRGRAASSGSSQQQSSQPQQPQPRQPQAQPPIGRAGRTRQPTQPASKQQPPIGRPGNRPASARSSRVDDASFESGSSDKGKFDSGRFDSVHARAATPFTSSQLTSSQLSGDAKPRRRRNLKYVNITGKRINILDWQAANKRYSVYLALFMVLLLGAIAYTAAVALGATYAWLYVGLAAALAVGQNAIAYWYGDQIALSVARARPANKDEHRYLVNITEAVAIGAGVPMPKLYVIDSPAPNAFATGRNPQHSTVAVTRGLIELLDRQELEGVIAHELAHVKNYDALLMSLLAATLGAIIILRDVILRMNRYGGRRRRGGGSNAGQAQAIAMILLLVLLILAPVLASIVRFAVSRRREYLADATAAYITRNPEGLARALTKVGDYQGERLEVSEGLRHMFISNPVKKLNATGLFATHPPLDERISRLQRM